MDRGVGNKRLDLYTLLTKLRATKGCIVLASECSPQTIIAASVDNNLYVDKDGVGYVYLPKAK